MGILRNNVRRRTSKRSSNLSSQRLSIEPLETRYLLTASTVTVDTLQVDDDVSTVHLIGDVDLNGVVDSADLGMLLNNVGTDSSQGWGSGDLNSDSVVDRKDLDLLTGNFGGDAVMDYTDPSNDYEVAAGHGSADCNGTIYPDANDDGVVDVSDFNIWNAHRTMTGTTFAQGDFNGDGTTDTNDFAIWNQFRFQNVPQEGNVTVEVVHLGQTFDTHVEIQGVDGSGLLLPAVNAFSGNAVSEGTSNTVCVAGDLSGGLTFIVDTDDGNIAGANGMSRLRARTGSDDVRFADPIPSYNNYISWHRAGVPIQNTIRDGIFLSDGDDFFYVVEEVYGVRDATALATKLSTHVDASGIVDIPDDSVLILFEQQKEPVGIATDQGFDRNAATFDYADIVLLVTTEELVQVTSADYYGGSVFGDGSEVVGATGAWEPQTYQYDVPGLLYSADGESTIREVRSVVRGAIGAVSTVVDFSDFRWNLGIYTQSDYFTPPTLDYSIMCNCIQVNYLPRINNESGLVANNAQGFVPSMNGSGYPDGSTVPSTALHTDLGSFMIDHYDQRFDNFTNEDTFSALDAGDYVVTFAGNYNVYGNGLSAVGKSSINNATDYVFSRDSPGEEPGSPDDEDIRRQIIPTSTYMIGLITEKTELVQL